MQRIIIAAAILLLLQVGLVVSFSTKDKAFEPYSPNVAVVSFVPEEIEGIQLYSEADSRLVLLKRADKWYIDADIDVPADSAQISAFLTKLAALKRGLAVATSKDAAARFKVSDKQFQSRLTLNKGKEIIADIYFGKSAGYKQLHARTAGSDEIITVPLGSQEVTAKEEQWIDNNLLKIDGKKVVSVEFNDILLKRESDTGWQADNGDGHVKEVENADSLLDKLCGLNVLGTVGASDVDFDSQSDSLEVSMTLDDGTKLLWKLAKQGENSFGVKRSDLQFSLSVSSWQAEELRDKMKDIESLFAKVTAEDESTD